MGNGSNKQSPQDTLYIGYSISRPDENHAQLDIRYWRKVQADIDPIQMTRNKLTFSHMTLEMAGNFTELLNKDILDIADLEGEGATGPALTYLLTRSIDSIFFFVEKMKQVAKSIGAVIVSPFEGYTVSCSVAPCILEGRKFGYQINVSYSDKSYGLPLSATSNTHYISEETFQFAKAFNTALNATGYAYLRCPNNAIVEEDFWGYSVHTIFCAEMLPTLLGHFARTAELLGCNLTILSIPGFTPSGWTYTKYDLKRYIV